MMSPVIYYLMLAGYIYNASPVIPSVCRQERTDIRVQQVIQVHSPCSFTCRIAAMSLFGLDSVPVRVQLKGITAVPSEDSSGWSRQGLELVNKLFVQAKVITLKNVSLSNYFRLYADVCLDGGNLADILVTEGFASLETEPLCSEKTPVERVTSLERDYSQVHQPRVSSRIALDKQKPVYTDSSIRMLLEQTVDMSVLGPDTRFQDALGILRNSVEPPLPLVVLWNDIEQNAMVSRDKTIGLEGMKKIKLRQALRLILVSVAAGAVDRLDAAVRDQAITVASKDLLQKSKPLNTVYDVSELAAARADFFYDLN